MSQNEETEKLETPDETSQPEAPEEVDAPEEDAEAPAPDEDGEDTPGQEGEDAEGEDAEGEDAGGEDAAGEDAEGEDAEPQDGEEAAEADPEPEVSEGAPAASDEEGDALGDELFLSPDDDEGEVIDITPEGDAPAITSSVMEPSPDDAPEVDWEATLAERDAEIEELRARVDDLAKERDDLKARLLRKQADMENFRKRKEREKEEMRKYGSDKLVLDLLPAIDNLERALDHAEKTAEESSIADGVRMVYKQLQSSMIKHGISSFESVGERFDPQRHEAIQQVETSEYETNTVMQEYQKGYFIHDRLLRPSLTVVAKYVAPPEPEEPEERSDDGEVELEESEPPAEGGGAESSEVATSE